MELQVGLVDMGSQVLSPTHVDMSQHGGKVPMCEPQEIVKISIIIVNIGSLLFYA